MNESTNPYNRIPGLIVYDLTRPEERLMYALAVVTPKQAVSLK
jgi:hypothetical protein